MPKRYDLTGKRFGRLTVICRDGFAKNGAILWLCKCDCGNEHRVKTGNLLNNSTQSCGCYKSEIMSERMYKHGLSNTKLHSVWRGMLNRCYTSSCHDYENYGGRGIKVCDQWKSSFYEFYTWAMTHGYKNRFSIDRIDVNGNYCPDNCRWANTETQSNNKRNNRFLQLNGESKTVSQWSKELNIDRKTITDRIDKFGWSVEDALTRRPGKPYDKRRDKANVLNT